MYKNTDIIIGKNGNLTIFLKLKNKIMTVDGQIKFHDLNKTSDLNINIFFPMQSKIKGSRFKLFKILDNVKLS